MFTTFIVQPIFNLLVLIYALLPGHNFGLAIIIFTIVIRLLLWPLFKKQLHHSKAIRALQPEIKKIKAASKGDRKKESMLTMELYKERGVSPFSALGVMILQIPILIGLFFGIQRIVKDPQQIIDFSYPWIRDLGGLKEIAQDITVFDSTLFGVVDLTRSAIGPQGLYIPALILVSLAAFVQYTQSKQLMPQSDDARSLRTILKDAGQGKTADQQEVNAAMGKGMIYLIPVFVFIFGLNFPAALPLYWLVSSTVAYLQQSKILKDDIEQVEALAEEPQGKKERPKPTAKTRAKKRPAAKRKKAKSARARRRK